MGCKLRLQIDSKFRIPQEVQWTSKSIESRTTLFKTQFQKHINHMTSDKVLNISVTQFSHPLNGMKTLPNSEDFCGNETV